MADQPADETDKEQSFGGFHGKVTWTQIPAPFFNELLPQVDDLAELKVLLFCFWALPQKPGRYPHLLWRDFVNDADLMAGLQQARPDAEPQATLEDALARAVKRGALLRETVTLEGQETALHFVNTERGCSGAAQVRAGEWQPGTDDALVDILPERPNIYRLYEREIGPLTPMIADDLKDMAAEYPSTWIEEAIHIAVQGNKRSLRYVRAILERWRKEGKDDGEANSGQNPNDGSRYVSGKYADFIEH